MQYGNSHAGFWRRRWTISLTQCYNCGFVFNLWHGKLPSLAVRRDGHYWSFRCPNCKRKTSFYLRSSKFDRAQPTYSDASRLMVYLLVIPVFAALVTIFYMQFMNTDYQPAVRLLFIEAQEIVLVASLVLILFVSWYYSNRIILQRIA